MSNRSSRTRSAAKSSARHGHTSRNRTTTKRTSTPATSAIRMPTRTRLTPTGPTSRWFRPARPSGRRRPRLPVLPPAACRCRRCWQRRCGRSVPAGHGPPARPAARPAAHRPGSRYNRSRGQRHLGFAEGLAVERRGLRLRGRRSGRRLRRARRSCRAATPTGPLRRKLPCFRPVCRARQGGNVHGLRGRAQRLLRRR